MIWLFTWRFICLKVFKITGKIRWTLKSSKNKVSSTENTSRWTKNEFKHTHGSYISRRWPSGETFLTTKLKYSCALKFIFCTRTVLQVVAVEKNVSEQFRGDFSPTQQHNLPYFQTKTRKLTASCKWVSFPWTTETFSVRLLKGTLNTPTRATVWSTVLLVGHGS